MTRVVQAQTHRSKPYQSYSLLNLNQSKQSIKYGTFVIYKNPNNKKI